MNKKVLITGGAGFVGHHIVEHFLKKTDWDIAIIDKLTYASNGLSRVRDINVFNPERVQMVTCDFTQDMAEGILQEKLKISIILSANAK